MIRSYFDLHDIGACEEVVPVTFATSSFSLGKDVTVRSPEGEPAAEVIAGHVANLPLWAAIPLRRGAYISVHLPTKYMLSTFREFKTDALAPNLALKSSYYYEAGLLLCSLLGNQTVSANGTVHISAEGNRLAAQLFRLFQLRYLKIIFAAAKKGFDLNDVREKLTESERHLLDSYLRGQAEEKLWTSQYV